MRSLDIAASGMLSQQLNVAVISNNIANLSTTGYKRQTASFEDLLYQHKTRVGVSSSDAGTIIPTGVQIGLGVKESAIYRNSVQGALEQTSNDFDLAISGRGFFVINTPDGQQAYTRDGTFKVNQDGEMVTSDGYVVAPGIIIPQDARVVQVNENGEVFATIDGQIDAQNLGQIEIVNFINEAGLLAEGGNLLYETAASGAPVAGIAGEENFGLILQGFVEASNVDAVSEITNLIKAQRSYELNSQVISKSDEMLASISNI